ncbi:MAG: dockerin type I domain-containing protein [Anaerolineae bacterium]
MVITTRNIQSPITTSQSPISFFTEECNDSNISQNTPAALVDPAGAGGAGCYQPGLQGGDGDTDLAHCRTCATPTYTPTPTLTPTPTPLPPLLLCQINPVLINSQTINPPPAILDVPAGQALNIRLFLQDSTAHPLSGAKVEATANQAAPSVQAAATPLDTLKDMAGFYDGISPALTTPGVYTFTFTANDPTGVRFAPCSTQRVVRIAEPTPVPTCQIKLEATPSPVTVNNPITLTAMLTNTLCASVTTTVQIPGDGSQPVNLAGSGNICTGSYTPVLTGTYTFTATGANSGNQPCTSNSVAVIVNPTATPPLTPTVDLNFPSQIIDLCRRTDPIAATLAISNVTSLTGVAVEVSYDKSFMQVIDAFGPPRPPLLQVEVKPDPNFDPWQRNEVDTNNGKIYFAANARTPVNGQTNVISIDWQPQGRTGLTPINATVVFTDASGVHTVTQTKSLEIIIDDVCHQGQVALQGRANHSGVLVSSAGGEQTRSYPTGLFAIASTEPLNFTFPGYLPAQVEAPASAAAVGTVTLRAGDVNGDNHIDILDLAQLAQHYLSTDVTTDLNSDGVVNILDLALVAGNFQQRGPLTSTLPSP